MKNVSSKRPLLVAPWKIGLLVALLLAVVGAGAGSYLVKMYNVELQWMSDISRPWQIDSYQFFKEMYPLVASIVILSLISYFVIAAAVRRYKSYLDSGQDYRAMVALAESIDDLTNPAQISKLSAYPELQSVLRNYGDSIGEISQELERKEKELNPEGIEHQIESLFKGQKVKAEAGDVRWERILGKVGDYFEANRHEIEGLREKSNVSRQMLSETVLSFGKLLETVTTAYEDILGIADAVKELGVIAASAGVGSAHASGDVLGPGGDGTSAIIDEMVNILNKLEDGGRVLSEFSTENNGLALNMALKAAKGAIDEHDLAHFAEKVRATAERFNRLSGTVSSIAQGLLGNCYQLAEKMSSGGDANRAIDAGSTKAVGEIAANIEERSSRLERSFSLLQTEMNEVYTALQGCVSAIAETAVRVAEKQQSVDKGEVQQSDDRSFVNFGGYSSSEPNEDSDMVIQRGGQWNTSFGSDSGAEGQASDEKEQMGDSEMLDEIDVTMGDESFLDETEESHATDQLADIPDDAYEQSPAFTDNAQVREYTIETDGLQHTERVMDEGYEEAPQNQPAAGWKELQQDREIGEKKPEGADGTMEQTPEQPPEAVEEVVDYPSENVIEEPSHPPVDEDRPATKLPAGEDRLGDQRINAPGSEWVKVDVDGGARDYEEQVNADAEDTRGDDDEPIYDLFELGAVEYVEETNP